MLEAVNLCREKRPVSAEFGIAVYDDYPFLDYLKPSLPAVRQPIVEMGKKAVEIIGMLISGTHPAGKITLISPSLHLR